MRALERAEVIERRTGPKGRTLKYRLTPAGRDLQPVVQAIGEWGATWSFTEPRPEELDPDLLIVWMARHVDRQRLPPNRTVVKFDFLRLAARGDDTDLTPDRDGVFHLKGGITYTLELFHHQPIDVTAGEPFTIAVDDAIIRVIGRSGFDIGSRYDRIAIPMHAVQSERYEARETVLVIDPADPVKGPQLRLPLRVDPPSKKL